MIYLLTVLTIGGGIHAYYMHSLEMGNFTSSRKWVYWIYSAIFLLLSSLNVVVLSVALAFPQTGSAIVNMAYASFAILLSYALTLAGIRSKIIY